MVKQFHNGFEPLLEAGKNGLTLSTRRDATTDEVRRLREDKS